MARTLIERFTSSFDHSKYEDEYRSKLLAVVERKRKGDEVHAPKEEEPSAPSDLLEALRASVESARKSRGSSNGRKRSRSTARSRGKRRAKSRS